MPRHIGRESLAGFREKKAELFWSVKHMDGWIFVFSDGEKAVSFEPDLEIPKQFSPFLRNLTIIITTICRTTLNEHFIFFNR